MGGWVSPKLLSVLLHRLLGNIHSLERKVGKRKTKALRKETILDVVLCIQLQGLLLPVCVREHVYRFSVGV